MRTMFIVILAALSGCETAPIAEMPRRVGLAASPLSTSVSVSPNSCLVYISGTVPEAVDAAAPEG